MASDEGFPICRYCFAYHETEDCPRFLRRSGVVKSARSMMFINGPGGINIPIVVDPSMPADRGTMLVGGVGIPIVFKAREELREIYAQPLAGPDDDGDITAYPTVWR